MKDYAGFWYVQYQGVEYGPFGFREVVAMLASGKLEETIHIWREGLAHWLPIRVDTLKGNTPALLVRRELIQYERNQAQNAGASASALVSSGGATRRQLSRTGLVATVFGVGAAGK